MGEDSPSMKKTVSGQLRLPDPVEDAILTLGVRMRHPASFEEIATSIGIASHSVGNICRPYQEFLDSSGAQGPGLAFTGRSPGRTVMPGAMWKDAAFGNSGRDAFQKQQLISGADRLADPVDDAILTLGVRLLGPLAYDEIAPLFGISRAQVKSICKPFKEFMRRTQAYGMQGLAYPGRRVR